MDVIRVSDCNAIKQIYSASDYPTNVRQLKLFLALAEDGENFQEFLSEPIPQRKSLLVNTISGIIR